MKFGATFPTTEIGNDPVVIRDFAQTAEDLGYSFLVTYDHVVGAVHANRNPKLPGPYDETHPFHEPMVLLSHLAAVTTRLQLSTNILILPQRQTVLAAKQCAELAVLSDNRFRLGLGIGWNTVEYEALGVPWKNRGARMDEQIELMRKLWSEPVIDFKGKYHRVDRGGIRPQPSEKIPIWFGGYSKRALQRAARIGDGFIGMGVDAPALDRIKSVKDMLAKEERSAKDFGIETTINVGRNPDGWVKVREAWEAEGMTHYCMRTMSVGTAWAGEPDPGFTTPQQHIDALETFMREMGG